MALKKKKRRVVKKKTSKKRKPVVKKAAKKKAPKKVLKKKAAKRGTGKAVVKKPKQEVIGVITHYFPKVRAAVIKLKTPLAVGDTIKVKGHTTDFIQQITSMQMDHVPVDVAKKGQEIGLLVNSRVRQHDIVCKP